VCLYIYIAVAVVFTISNKERILVERTELDRRNKWSGITCGCQNFPLTELLQTKVLDLLDIILLSLKGTTLTDPFQKPEKTQSSEIIALTFLSVLPRPSFRPSFLLDTFMITSKPSHEELLFLLLDKFSV